MNLTFKHKNKKIELEVKKCNLFSMVRGLMFTRKDDAKALLLFNFNKPNNISIHSYFVFFPFVAIWLDNKNKIVDLRIVKPFKLGIYSKKSFTKIVEIPINKKYNRVIKLLVGD